MPTKRKLQKNICNKNRRNYRPVVENSIRNRIFLLRQPASGANYIRKCFRTKFQTFHFSRGSAITVN